MKLLLNRIIIVFFIFMVPMIISGNIINDGDYKLEIREKNGRFMLSMKNNQSEYTPVFSDTDLSTSRFSIFENNGFYTLGDSSRFQKIYNEKTDGGIFIWTSKELLIEQEFTLNSDGFLYIDISINNISTDPKTIGMKFLLDTAFEDEDYFYLKTESERMNIVSEFEVQNPKDYLFWTSGARNSKGSAIMGIPSDQSPSRIIFGNWDLLDDADFNYQSKPGRNFNSPPFSINDCAILYLFPHQAIHPNKNLKYTIILKPINTVEDVSKLVLFEMQSNKNEVVAVDENTDPALNIPKQLTEKVEALDKNKETVLKSEILIENEVSLEVGNIEVINRRIKTVNEIQKLIETLSKPGIINVYNLSQLEELINKLEIIITNEN